MSRGDISAWNKLFEALGKSERFAEPTEVSHPQPKPAEPQRRGDVKAWNRLFEKLDRPERFAEPPSSPPPKQEPTIAAEIRSLIAQGVPPEKAVQIIQEKYGVKAEIRKVEMPSLHFISQKIGEVRSESIKKFEKEHPEVAAYGKLLDIESEIGYKLMTEKNPFERLKLAIEYAPVGIATHGISYFTRAFTGEPVGVLTKPLAPIGKSYSKMVEDFAKRIEEKAKVVLGTEKERQTIYQTIFTEGTISKTPSPEIAKIAKKEEPFLHEFLKSPATLAGTPVFAYELATKPAEVATGLAYQARTEPLGMLGSIVGTGLITSGLPEGAFLAKTKLGEFKPIGTITRVGERTYISKESLPLFKMTEGEPVLMRTIEASFAMRKGEGLGVAKTAAKIGKGFKIPAEKIEVTRIYRNLLGQKATIRGVFTEEGGKIIAEKGKEVRGIGYKVLESSKGFTQEIPEKPPVTLDLGGKLVRVFVEGKEEKSSGKPIVETRKSKIFEEIGKISKESERIVEVGKGVEQIVKTEEKAKDTVNEVSIPFTIERAMTAMEEQILRYPTGVRPPMPLFAIPTPSLSIPSFPAITPMSFEAITRGIEPAVKTQQMINVGVAPEITFKTPSIPAINLPTLNIPTIFETLRFDVHVSDILRTVSIQTTFEKPTYKTPTLRVPTYETPAFEVPRFGVGIPNIPITPLPIPTGLPWLGGGIQGISRPPGKKKGKKGKKAYIGLLAGYTEVTLTEMLTGEKAKHLMVPEVMAKEWLTTLRTGGMIEVPTFEEITGELRKGWRI